MGSHWRALAPPMSHERGRRERNVKRWLSRDKMPIDTIGDSRTKLVRVNLTRQRSASHDCGRVAHNNAPRCLACALPQSSRSWPHTLLAALAAKALMRPVRL